MVPHGRYRPEIDGLRAIAILPVLFFHFGVPGFSGGFTGVDVFFVISGFLIGGILWSELRETGRIRLGRFFLRRIRRLAPAYYVMAFTAFVAAWLILLPYEFREFGKEMIAATVYLSNVYFYGRTGYFDVLGEERVLLHTWSLAVEEQFYVVVPILLILAVVVLKMAPRLVAWGLLALGLMSLAACVIVTPMAHSATFYLFPFRAWELLTGVLLAIAGYEAGLTWRGRPWMSWAGVTLIAAGMVFLEPGTSFPGAWALLPVAGAALVIANGQDANPVNRALTTRPFLFFGAISYSLYLWHWPIVTLATYRLGELDWPTRILLMALSVALAWLSLRLIENPVRRSTWRWPVVVGGYGAASVAALALAAMVYLGDGLIWRFPPNVQAHIAATQDFRQDWTRCRTPDDGAFAGVEVCPIGPEGDPRVLVWGDSHARAWKEGLDRAAFDAGVPGLLIWRGGCPPLIGIAKDESVADRIDDEACTDHNRRVADGLTGMPSLEKVLMVGRWSYYTEGSGSGRDAENLITLAPVDDLPEQPGETQASLFARGLAHTLDRIDAAGLEAVALRQTPEISIYHSLEAARGLAYGQVTEADLTNRFAQVDRAEATARQASADRILDDLAAAGRLTLIGVRDRLCDDGVCSALRPDGRSFYFDNNHITNTAAIEMRDVFVPAFAEAGS